MKSINNPLKMKYPQHELLSKLSLDMDIQNRLKLVEISKYRKFIKKNNYFDKFSGKKHLIDRDILLSNIFKLKYKETNDNTYDQQLLERSFTIPKVVATPSLPTKNRDFSLSNPFRVTNENFNKFRVTSNSTFNNPFRVTSDSFNTNRIRATSGALEKTDRNKLKGFLLKKFEIKHRANKSSIPLELSPKKKKSIEMSFSVLYKKYRKVNKNTYPDNTVTEGSSIYKCNPSSNNYLKSGDSLLRETSCSKIKNEKIKRSETIYDINKKKIKVVCFKELSKFNKISTTINDTLKKAKLELMQI